MAHAQLFRGAAGQKHAEYLFPSSGGRFPVVDEVRTMPGADSSATVSSYEIEGILLSHPSGFAYGRLAREIFLDDSWQLCL